jgi:hypothetical protein
MDDYSLPSSLLPPHLLIAPLGVDCKFAVHYNKKKLKEVSFLLQYIFDGNVFKTSHRRLGLNDAQ